MTSPIVELYGLSTEQAGVAWKEVVKGQGCPYLNRRCIKVRKSRPDLSIGTCTVQHGKKRNPLVICPWRLLERRQVFTDCLHLLALHEPGNELHLVSEVSIPGGGVDFFLVSARGGRVMDFVGVELQSVDTTGTLWPERQRFLKAHGLEVSEEDAASAKGYGVNWKMSAKTILVQLHHKIETFESINKHLVLGIQDHFLAYMRGEFSFEHLNTARLGDPLHVHAYALQSGRSDLRLVLTGRLSTDAAGIARCLGLLAPAKVELEDITRILQARLSDNTLLTL
jgi:hypothetical protein